MPIEIRELIIKVTVHDEGRLPAARPEAAVSTEAREQLRREITESCVRQVLAQLRRRQER
ncbi:DUF5908 family protein [Hymenobacter perfusus]|uniref:Uncharacterized protein n=1 Tax=Hymenobacter perfusus TaxID=1236770 RepID=A0A428KAI6_9BACT|nr:DUF5908 family protein [Hymenobacter perfusus]RSK43447.1 hypothetical protein EI293_11165 [Hymenobacter perfusus]